MMKGWMGTGSSPRVRLTPSPKGEDDGTAPAGLFQGKRALVVNTSNTTVTRETGNVRRSAGANLARLPARLLWLRPRRAEGLPRCCEKAAKRSEQTGLQMLASERSALAGRFSAGRPTHGSITAMSGCRPELPSLAPQPLQSRAYLAVVVTDDTSQLPGSTLLAPHQCESHRLLRDVRRRQAAWNRCGEGLPLSHRMEEPN